MQYQHPGWNKTARRNAWKRRAESAGVGLPAPRAAIPQEDFVSFYKDVRVQTTLRSLDYAILTVEMTATEATVGFEVTLHTLIAGDISRTTRMLMKREGDAWKVAGDGHSARADPLEDPRFHAGGICSGRRNERGRYPRRARIPRGSGRGLCKHVHP